MDLSLYNQEDKEDAILDGYMYLLEKILRPISIPQCRRRFGGPKDRKEYFHNYYLNRIKDPIYSDKRKMRANRWNEENKDRMRLNHILWRMKKGGVL